MTVVVRRVASALHREYRKAGGVRIADAVAYAEGNLGTLEEQCRVRIDEAMEGVAAIVSHPDRLLTTEDLSRAHGLVNEMLACCAAVEIDGFVEALYACGRLIGILLAIDTRPVEALSPGVDLLRLARRGAAPEDLEALIAGIDHYVARIQALGRISGRN